MCRLFVSSRLVFSLLAAMAASSLAAQAPADSLRIIRGIRIETSDVFPASEAHGFVPRVFNGLHITTRGAVVRREVLQKIGEPFDSAAAAQTERSLRALRIFRRVRVDTVRADSGLVLRVETQDAFTTRVEGSIEGSTKASKWWVALNELNLLGTATRLGVRYRHEPDRNAVTTSFQRNRLIDSRIGVTAFYDDRSDGRMLYGVVALPFYSFQSPSSWYVSGEERQERIFRFFEGRDVATDTLQRRYWMARSGVGVAVNGTSTGYLRAGIDGQIRRDDYARQARVDTLGRSVSGALTGYLEWRAARFLVSRDFEGFGRQEDVDLSTVIHAGLGVTPKAWGYEDFGVVPQMSMWTGLGWRGGFARAYASALGRFGSAGLDSGSVHVSGTVVLKPRLRQMMVLHGAHGWQKNPMPGGEFDLGIGVGPRGFTQHAFTGDRAFLLATEYRYLVTDNFLRSAGLGLAAFADYGGAWYHGQARRTGYSVGVGLRFGLTVASDLAPARVDLAWINGTGLTRGAWRLAFGKGFVFGTSGRLDR